MRRWLWALVVVQSGLALMIVPFADAATTGIQITAGPSNPSTSPTATFQFSDSLDAGAVFECQLDGTGYSPCPTPYVTPALANGVHTLIVRNAAVSDDQDSFTWMVDTASSPSLTIYLTPPSVVRRATATAGDGTVVLTWSKPAGPSLAAVRIARSTVGHPGSEIVYRGLRNTFKAGGLSNGVTYRFVLVGIDRAGNTSLPVVVSATPKPTPLASPKPGAQIAKPPLLRWIADAPAGYFNVQLYRSGTKILSAWPARARLQLPSHWAYGRHAYSLKPGVYTWYVWPGIGARQNVKYGALLGRSSFVVVASGTRL